MKVAQLARLLDNVVSGLDGVINNTAAHELNGFANAMQAFGNASVAEFTKFLGQFGLEFQQNGKIDTKGKIAFAKPGKPPKQDPTEQVQTTVASIKALFAEIDRGLVDDSRLEQILKPAEKLTVAQLHEVLQGLDIAERPRAKAKIMDAIKRVVHHQIESRARSGSVGQ